ncbi:MAG: hypothetical protein HY301_02025 [Verrucomicrobia bacterium]|nr:hypothetical protein [Verrucomicrobiota bacterium]
MAAETTPLMVEMPLPPAASASCHTVTAPCHTEPAFSMTATASSVAAMAFFLTETPFYATATAVVRPKAITSSQKAAALT